VMVCLIGSSNYDGVGDSASWYICYAVLMFSRCPVQISVGMLVKLTDVLFVSFQANTVVLLLLGHLSFILNQGRPNVFF
jgi:hypothetical protein